jgi:hypothetical protein
MLAIDQVAVVSNDEAAERILRDAGVLKAARPIPPFDTATFAFHWDGFSILSKWSEGFPKPEDNGIILFMVPDGAGTIEEIAEFIYWAAECGRVPGTPSVMVATV